MLLGLKGHLNYGIARGYASLVETCQCPEWYGEIILIWIGGIIMIAGYDREKNTSILDMPDDEIEEALRRHLRSANVGFSVNHVLDILNSRAQNRHADAMEKLTRSQAIFSGVIGIATFVNVGFAIVNIFVHR